MLPPSLLLPHRHLLLLPSPPILLPLHLLPVFRPHTATTLPPLLPSASPTRIRSPTRRRTRTASPPAAAGGAAARTASSSPPGTCASTSTPSRRPPPPARRFSPGSRCLSPYRAALRGTHPSPAPEFSGRGREIDDGDGRSRTKLLQRRGETRVGGSSPPRSTCHTLRHGVVAVALVKGEGACTSWLRSVVAIDCSVRRGFGQPATCCCVERLQDFGLQKIDDQIKCINEMCNMMSLDLKKTLYEVHPSFVELERIKAMSISDSTLDRLAEKVHALNQEKKQRLRKLQDLGSTLIELWSLMDTPLDEQKCFDHVTSLISVSPNTVIPQGCLAHDLIEKVEVEVKRLKHLKASKMKELVLKKMTELEEIYRSVHMDIDSDHEWRILTELIDSGPYLVIH